MSKHTLINVDGPELKFTRGPDPDDEKSVVTLSSTTTFGTSATGFRDSQEIRSRLLSRLGIYDAPPGMAASASATHQPMTAAQHRRARILRGMGVGYTVFKSPPDGSAHRTPLGGVTPSKEPLKTGESSSSLSSSRRHHKKSNSTGALYSDVSTNSKSTRIMFQDEVEVMPIPTRHEYSDRIKSRIWSNRHELQENAERNAVEFATEGWNWRTVTEDEGMYICSLSGDLIHPAWVSDLPRVSAGVGGCGEDTGVAASAKASKQGGGLPTPPPLERSTPAQSNNQQNNLPSLPANPGHNSV